MIATKQTQPLTVRELVTQSVPQGSAASVLPGESFRPYPRPPQSEPALNESPCDLILRSTDTGKKKWDSTT